MFKKGFSALLRGVEAVLEGLGTKSPTVIALGGHPETHILGETFYSQAPLRWGDYVAKVAVAPVSPELTALTGAALNVNGKPNGLREAVAAFFAAQAGVWEIWAQLLTNCETMPVEDASVPWPEAESPYRPLWRASPCRVRRPGATRRRGLAMTASSSVLGTASPPIVRSAPSCARRVVYPRSAGFRAEHNGCPIHEPGSAAAFRVWMLARACPRSAADSRRSRPGGNRAGRGRFSKASRHGPARRESDRDPGEP